MESIKELRWWAGLSALWRSNPHKETLGWKRCQGKKKKKARAKRKRTRAQKAKLRARGRQRRR